jgi:hypothetical protein
MERIYRKIIKQNFVKKCTSLHIFLCMAIMFIVKSLLKKGKNFDGKKPISNNVG